MSWYATADTGPRYGTWPSMPSGMSLSSLGTSAWKYRSFEYEVCLPRVCIAPRDPMPRYSLNCLPDWKTISPGDSSVPASSEPSITASAPATSALAMSPEYCNPPSAMTGMPAGAAASDASYTAVTCGTPTPATMRVVQIEPAPTPTLTASTPASTSACAPSRVATLPPMTSMCSNVGSDLSRLTRSITPCD